MLFHVPFHIWFFPTNGPYKPYPCVYPCGIDIISMAMSNVWKMFQENIGNNKTPPNKPWNLFGVQLKMSIFKTYGITHYQMHPDRRSCVNLPVNGSTCWQIIGDSCLAFWKTIPRHFLILGHSWKYPAYGRQSISRPTRIVARIPKKSC